MNYLIRSCKGLFRVTKSKKRKCRSRWKIKLILLQKRKRASFSLGYRKVVKLMIIPLSPRRIHPPKIKILNNLMKQSWRKSFWMNSTSLFLPTKDVLVRDHYQVTPRFNYKETNWIWKKISNQKLFIQHRISLRIWRLFLWRF